jgi:hypothetical protein
MDLTVPGNSGRRYARPVALATESGARVRLPVTSPQGKPLPSVSDSMSAQAARAYGLALIEAAALAEYQAATLARQPA